eukprot:6176807-Pleurochrysis_carterae.AAC.1
MRRRSTETDCHPDGLPARAQGVGVRAPPPRAPPRERRSGASGFGANGRCGAAAGEHGSFPVSRRPLIGRAGRASAGHAEGAGVDP